MTIHLSLAAPRRIALIPFAFAAALRLSAQTVPSTINYQGRLTDNGPTPAPITATVNMSFEIWDVQSGGTATPDRLWIEPASGSVPVQVTNGIFSILLGGNGVPLPGSLFSGGTTRYLQIIANGETLAPRQTIAATGYANQAQNATQAVQSTNADYATAAGSANNSAALGAVSAANYQAATNQSCAAGSFLSAISSSGGSATCASADNALIPPLSLAATTASPIITANNTGTGSAAQFFVTGSGVTNHALEVQNNGTGAVGYFTSSNAGGSSSIIFADGSRNWFTLSSQNDGAGASAGAATFFTTSATNISPTVYVVQEGTGDGLQVKVDNAAARGITMYGAASQTANLTEWRNNSLSLLSWVDAAGGFHGNGSALTGVTASGLTLPYSGTDSGNGASAFTVVKNGTAGDAGEFFINSASNGGNAVYANTAGTGRAGYFTLSNSANASNGVEVAHAGTGYAIYGYNSGTGGGAFFQQSNSAASAAALSASNTGSGPGIFVNANGTGRAGNFRVNIASNTSDALLAQTSGTGVALHGLANNASAKPLVAQGAAGQTANLQEWQNSAATVLSWVDSAGGFHGNGSGLTGVTASTLTPPVTLSASNTLPIISSTNTGNGNGVSGFAATGTAVYGGATSNGTGVYGTSSTGVAGDFEITNSANPSTALYVKTTGTGIGVYGASANVGVEGDGSTAGVYGYANAAGASAVKASGYGSTGTALELSSGGIKVTGAGDNTTTAAFIHRATAPVNNYTCINNPMTNGNPNALLIVTQNWSPPTSPNVYNPHPVGVFYTGTTWCIFNEDQVAMPVNAAFNVLVIKP